MQDGACAKVLGLPAGEQSCMRAAGCCADQYCPADTSSSGSSVGTWAAEGGSGSAIPESLLSLSPFSPGSSAAAVQDQHQHVFAAAAVGGAAAVTPRLQLSDNNATAAGPIASDPNAAGALQQPLLTAAHRHTATGVIALDRVMLQSRDAHQPLHHGSSNAIASSVASADDLSGVLSGLRPLHAPNPHRFFTRTSTAGPDFAGHWGTSSGGGAGGGDGGSRQSGLSYDTVHHAPPARRSSAGSRLQTGLPPLGGAPPPAHEPPHFGPFNLAPLRVHAPPPQPADAPPPPPPALAVAHLDAPWLPPRRLAPLDMGLHPALPLVHPAPHHHHLPPAAVPIALVVPAANGGGGVAAAHVVPAAAVFIPAPPAPPLPLLIPGHALELAPPGQPSPAGVIMPPTPAPQCETPPLLRSFADLMSPPSTGRRGE
jgi:hypothetical protein